MVKYLNDCFIIDLISPKQLGFRPGDSGINQLLSINHEILRAFDIALEVRGLFLDISKAFDKVWHAGLIYKLRQNGSKYGVISGPYFSVFGSEITPYLDTFHSVIYVET